METEERGQAAAMISPAQHLAVLQRWLEAARVVQTHILSYRALWAKETGMVSVECGFCRECHIGRYYDDVERAIMACRDAAPPLQVELGPIITVEMVMKRDILPEEALPPVLSTAEIQSG